MNNFFKIRLYITGLVTISIGGLLAWNYTHGGVPSHHILANKDLPEISNWWGGILLPILTWFILFRIENRDKLEAINFANIPKKIITNFVGALLYGILLAVLFTFNFNEVLDYFFPSIVVMSLFYPIYRAECLLGFIIGMTFTFGAILPTGIGSILSIISFLTYNLIRPILLLAIKYLKQKST